MPRHPTVVTILAAMLLSGSVFASYRTARPRFAPSWRIRQSHGTQAMQRRTLDGWRKACRSRTSSAW